MSKFPGARWRPVTRYQPGGDQCQPMASYDGGIDHTFVGSPPPDAAFAHFNTVGNPIPHFMIYRDGSIDQYVDTRFRASACLEGNPRLIAWETADGFSALWSNGQAPEDTPAMVQSKAELMAWLHTEHGIPLERMPSSRPTARGFGWHRLGCDGNYEEAPGKLLGGRVAGGEHWTSSFGKTCPTTRRIHQFVEETLPAAVALVRVTRVPRRLVFHIKHGLFYYVEDSLRGVRLALARLFGWIDLDIQKTKDDVLIVAHGPRPLSDRGTGGFEDTGKDVDDPIRHTDIYADLTWAQVQRLRSADGKGYRVWRADELIPRAIKKGLKVEGDAKTPHITEADWAALRETLPNPNHFQVKAFPKFARSLKAAHNTEFKTIVLLHTAEEASVPTAAQKFIDYFRGRTPIWIPTKETP